MPNQFIIDDGIISWYDGPEWDEVAYEAFRDAAPLVEVEAQANAPWEDRTGDARAGLKAEAFEDNDGIGIELAHTVEYGYWLEVIQNGRFGIIMETLENFAPRVIDEAIDRIRNARRGRW